MEGLIEALGGLDSWWYISLMLGCYFVGGLIIYFHFVGIFIFGFGIILMFKIIENEALEAESLDGWMLGAVDVIPIIFMICGILVTFILVGKSRWGRKYFKKDDTGGKECSNQ